MVFFFLGVYGSCDQLDFVQIGEELLGIRNTWNVPWCLGGDFNVVCYPSEKLGASRLSNQMRCFFKFIEDQGLVDLPLNGAKFTWTNNQARRGSGHLYRFLFSLDWMYRIG